MIYMIIEPYYACSIDNKPYEQVLIQNHIQISSYAPGIRTYDLRLETLA